MMDVIKNYVKYVDVKNSEIVNSLNRFDSKLQILTEENGVTKVNPISKDGYWPSRFKYAKNINDINDLLSDNEILVIEINIDDLNKIDEKNLFSVRFPEKEDKNKIGLKNYLVPWDFSFDGLSKEIANAFEPVVVLKNVIQYETKLETYRIRAVHTIRDNIGVRRQDISSSFGGVSDLYYRTTDLEVALEFADDVTEFIQVAPGTWVVSKLPNYMKEQNRK